MVVYGNVCRSEVLTLVCSRPGKGEGGRCELSRCHVQRPANRRKEPWIAFRTLAAGAFALKAGFQFAFQNGADSICVGMFDWQVVDNVNTVLDVLADVTNRQRPWRA